MIWVVVILGISGYILYRSIGMFTGIYWDQAKAMSKKHFGDVRSGFFERLGWQITVRMALDRMAIRKIYYMERTVGNIYVLRSEFGQDIFVNFHGPKQSSYKPDQCGREVIYE